MRGKIFSIEEFSTFDGPGIRTTVFLKGCPLRCTWCHNPEGQLRETEYMRNANGCAHCGACERAGTQTDGGLRLTEASAAACARGLVRQSGEDITAEALAERIKKNADILRSSGGGVTFSGGEPLMQSAFVLDCARRLSDVSIALQTSGFADSGTFEKTLSVCDYVLYDLKIMDNALHKRYCGAENAPIRENYRTLVSSGKRFVTRIPLITGITDTETNLRDIASFLWENGVSYAELLPYNKLAGSKYGALLREYTPCLQPELSCETPASLFEAYGIVTKMM